MPTHIHGEEWAEDQPDGSIRGTVRSFTADDIAEMARELVERNGLSQKAAQLVAESRASRMAVGLPPSIEDPEQIAEIAALLSSAYRPSVRQRGKPRS